MKVYVADKRQIETMKFEDYIQGVVAAEMDPEWPQEALAAQAIVPVALHCKNCRRRWSAGPQGMLPLIKNSGL